MEIMKYPGNMAVSGNGSHIESEVDSLLMTSCWQNSNSNMQSDFLDSQKLILDSNLSSDKLLLDSTIGGQENEIATKATMDVLDNLLMGQPINANLAELKPLPPFAGYTGHLSINGIQGHHYHAIAQRIPEENNNYSNYSNEQNIVSSSTCNVSADSAGDNDKLYPGVDEVVKLGYADCVNPDSVSSAKIYDDCGHPTADSVTHVKTEIAEYDISSIEDIAAIIGSAIADTTVPNSNLECGEDPTASRDSWMDLDAWIDTACGETKSVILQTQDGLSEFVIPAGAVHNNNNNNNNTSNNNHNNVEYNSKNQNQNVEYSSKMQNQSNGGSTLQSLLTHGYNMPSLLQSRLQNGPTVKQEAPSSTSYGVELISTSSPPANVVSTTDNIILNGRYIQHYNVIGGIQDDRIRSPDLLGQNYPHTTTTTPNAPKKSRSRAPKKQQQAASSTVFQTEQNLGLLGKEKPVHRCNICNRGFLNKSNIKVHLRTHTGEKPFRCETCAKAFRQKAHLIKHQQIHKRIGRD